MTEPVLWQQCNIVKGMPWYRFHGWIIGQGRNIYVHYSVSFQTSSAKGFPMCYQSFGVTVNCRLNSNNSDDFTMRTTPFSAKRKVFVALNRQEVILYLDVWEGSGAFLTVVVGTVDAFVLNCAAPILSSYISSEWLFENLYLHHLFCISFASCKLK